MAEAVKSDGEGQAIPLRPNRSPLAVLRHRDFRLYWGGQMVSSAGTMMQQAAVAWQVYLLSHSALALGLIGLFRVVPIVAFSLGGGVVADVVDRRRLLLVTQSVLLVVSGTLAVTTLRGWISIWVIYGLIALAASAGAFDNPARQAMVPSLVPREELTSALSLTNTVFQVASIAGPALAGLIIASTSVAAVYVIDAVSFLAVIAALLVIRPPRVVGAAQKISLGAAMEGLRFVWQTPILLSTMLLDFAATFFGSATALLPIFARDVLRVGSAGYGVLYAAPAAGSIVAGVVMTVVAARIGRQGRVILVAVGAYSLCTILFGLSHVFLFSLVALAGVGASDTVSTVLRQTVRQTLTPDALRGRMSSVSMIFFMGGPQLGELEAGAVARGFGAPISVIFGGVCALIATILIAGQSERLRRFGRA